MLDIKFELKGNDACIAGMKRHAREIPKAVQRALVHIIRLAHAYGIDKLSGPGRKKVKSRSYRGSKPTRKRGQFDFLGGAQGSYPIPVITGFLRRSLGIVLPGRIKTSNGTTFMAGRMQAVLFNSAAYAGIIHEGHASSAKYGARKFIYDAINKVNMRRPLGYEISRALNG